jgi:hypothetical protein
VGLGPKRVERDPALALGPAEFLGHCLEVDRLRTHVPAWGRRVSMAMPNALVTSAAGDRIPVDSHVFPC